MSAFERPSQRDPVAKLIFELSKLPGIGEKTATRLAYFILKQDPTYPKTLAEALIQAKDRTISCEKCYTFTDVSPCRICTESSRDVRLICVVERPSDVVVLEQAAVFRGTYHVLHGVISPFDGIGPDDLKIRELLERLRLGGDSPVREIILATNPSVEGEATALYLTKLLKPLAIKVTKLAYGIPVGGMIEFTDRQTLGRAIQNRMEAHS